MTITTSQQAQAFAEMSVQFNAQVEEAAAKLQAIREVYKSPDPERSQMWIVTCDKLALKFDIVNGCAISPTTCKPWNATLFTKRDAEAVAANVKNGAGKNGEVAQIEEATQATIMETSELLRKLKARLCA